MPTVTVSSMILRGLQMLGEKALGASLTTAEQNAYLDVMNSMLDSWSVDRTYVYSIATTNFALTAGTVSYTIGSGGTFDMTRPIRIVTAFTRDSNNYDSQITIIPQDRYAALKVKSTGNSYPTWMYYDGAEVGGLATIFLYPAPVASLRLHIGYYQPLQSFAAMSTALVLPPGYQRAIESNFAAEAGPGFVQVSNDVLRIARESKAAIKNLNVPTVISRVDSAVTGIGVRAGSSILTGP